MKYTRIASVFLLALSLTFAALPWQVVNITEPKQSISVSGLSAFPGIGLTALIVLLSLFVTRYAGLLIQRVIVTLGSALVIAVGVPVFASLYFGPFDLATKQIAEVSGISGWNSQVEQVLAAPPEATFAPHLYLATVLLFIGFYLASPKIMKSAPGKRVSREEPELWVN